MAHATEEHTLNRHQLAGRQSCARQGGFTLVEVSVSMVMLSAALGLMVSSVLSLTHARRMAVERQAVATTMTRALETLQALGPTDAYLTYEGIPADSGPGAPFVVPGLQGPNGAVVIDIAFLTDELANEPSLGLPRDLDGDGAASNGDVGKLDANGKLIATILPARLSATWRSLTGDLRTITWATVITDT